MATILDVGLIQYFQVIYPVLFVFAIVFAVLQKTKALTDAVAINALIAVLAGFMVLLSRRLIDVINFMIPWFVVVIIFFILMLLIFRVFGAEEDVFKKALTGGREITYIIIGIVIVIMIAAFANVYGQTLLGESAQAGTVEPGTGVASGSFQQNIYATLFHPKVLGMLILFGIAIAAVALLSSG